MTKFPLISWAFFPLTLMEMSIFTTVFSGEGHYALCLHYFLPIPQTSLYCWSHKITDILIMVVKIKKELITNGLSEDCPWDQWSLQKLWVNLWGNSWDFFSQQGMCMVRDWMGFFILSSARNAATSSQPVLTASCPQLCPRILSSPASMCWLSNVSLYFSALFIPDEIWKYLRFIFKEWGDTSNNSLRW